MIGDSFEACYRGGLQSPRRLAWARWPGVTPASCDRGGPAAGDRQRTPIVCLRGNVVRPSYVYLWGLAIPAVVGLGAMAGICSPHIAIGEARRRGVLVKQRISAAGEQQIS